MIPKSFALSFATALVLMAPATHAELAVKSGETIAFMGDSITAEGKRAKGYCTLVVKALTSQGVKVNHIPAGKSGHKSTNMLERLDNDVISKKPDWMTLSCGVNDVWHFKLVLGKRAFEGVELEDYKKNITKIIDKSQAAGIKVMVLTSTMIGEDPTSELNRMLVPYNDFLRKIAKEKGCLLADLSKDMHKQLKEIPDEKGKARMFGDPNYKREIKNKLTKDGCHMNVLGNQMMARGILRAFGMSEAQLTKAEKAW